MIFELNYDTTFMFISSRYVKNIKYITIQVLNQKLHSFDVLNYYKRAT